MNGASWYLRRGAVWKTSRAASGSSIYVPALRQTFTLDAATTRLLTELGGSHYTDALPETIAGLVRDGVLSQRADKGCPLVINRVEPRLDYVVLRLTNACNLRCRHCFVASGKPEPEELSLAEIGQLFESLDVFEPLVIVLTGGEPLLRKDVFDIVSLAAQHNVAVDISTNGTLLRPPVLERLAGLLNLRYVIVSLEGPWAHIHDGVRGPGNFDTTTTLVRALVERGVTVSVNHCVTAINLPYLSKTIDLALGLGAQSVHLATVSESGRAREHWSELALTSKQRLQVSLVALRKSLETGRVLAGEAEREVSGLAEDPGEIHSCGVGRDWCMIYANGDVAPCRPVYTAVGAAGNIRRQSFEALWRDSPLLNSLRAIRDDEIPRCASCHWRPRCHAGCRARAYMQTGSWTEPESEAHCRARGIMNLQVDRMLSLTDGKSRSIASVI